MTVTLKLSGRPHVNRDSTVLIQLFDWDPLAEDQAVLYMGVTPGTTPPVVQSDMATHWTVRFLGDLDSLQTQTVPGDHQKAKARTTPSFNSSYAIAGQSFWVCLGKLDGSSLNAQTRLEIRA